jgi:hypothetical protein
MKRDSSGTKHGETEPVVPGSFRQFDMSDAVAFPGVNGMEPDTYINMNGKTGTIDISTKSANISVSARESGDLSIETKSGKIDIVVTTTALMKAPEITLDGNVHITGTLTVGGEGGGSNMWMRGDIHQIGYHESTGDQIAGTVSQMSHVHTGVTPGGGDTGIPEQ